MIKNLLIVVTCLLHVDLVNVTASLMINAILNVAKNIIIMICIYCFNDVQVHCHLVNKTNDIANASP